MLRGPQAAFLLARAEDLLGPGLHFERPQVRRRPSLYARLYKVPLGEDGANMTPSCRRL